MALVCVLALVALLLAAQPSPSGETQRDAKLPLAFVVNAGQTDKSVRYVAREAGNSFYFRPDKVVLDFQRGRRGVALELRFRGANPQPQIVAERRAPGHFNYLVGSQHKTSLATYSQLRYRDLWPGIDMVFRGTNGNLKYEFLVSPGADPGDIRLAYAGSDSLALGEAGSLLIGTPLGTLRDAAPTSFQGGKSIDSRYALSGSAYGFKFGSYDHSRSLVVDPGLVWSTYLGGLDSEYAADVEVDGGGNAYVTGETRSASFPTTPGAYDTVVGGVYDTFVTKLDASGALVYSTYLGGSDDDHGFDIDLSGGSAFVTGFSSSSDFPTTPGAYDGTLDGTGQYFAAKLNPAGSGLAFATFVPGGQVTGIAVDASGRSYLTGTAFADQPIPISPNAPDTTTESGDAFLERLNASGSAIDWATYIGGRGLENGRAVHLDAAGEPYVVGRTTSVEEFPFTPGAFDTTNEGESIFVAKVDAGGTSFDYATLVGNGINSDLAVDAAGHAYVSGTGSLPSTPGAYDDDGCSYVAKMNLTGTGVVFSTRLGPLCNVSTVDVDPAGNVYLSQLAQESDANLPATPGAFDAHRDDYDGFIFKLNSTGTGQLYGTYLGGSSFDHVTALAPVGTNSVVVTGYTRSTDFPTTPGAHDQTYNGVQDAYATRLQTFDGFPRPKGAGPLYISLVTSYKFRSCSSSQEMVHGPPLAYSSCPPRMESDYLTVGTGDSNGLPARNDGYMRFDVVAGNPATPADEADVKVGFFLDDIFNTDLTDYAGELRPTVTVQITDRDGPESVMSTEQDFLLPFVAPCATNPDPQEGSACALTTTIDSVYPGWVKEGRRSIWKIEDVEVYDGGPDGDADTVPGQTLFARRGVFIP